MWVNTTLAFAQRGTAAYASIQPKRHKEESLSSLPYLSGLVGRCTVMCMGLTVKLPVKLPLSGCNEAQLNPIEVRWSIVFSAQSTPTVHNNPTVHKTSTVPKRPYTHASWMLHASFLSRSSSVQHALPNRNVPDQPKATQPNSSFP